MIHLLTQFFASLSSSRSLVVCWLVGRETFVKKWYLEYQLITKTYLKLPNYLPTSLPTLLSTYLPTYLCDSSDSSDSIDNSDSCEKKRNFFVHQKTFFPTTLFLLNYISSSTF